MALVDPNIAMSYRGIEVPNQLAHYGQLAQIQNAQNQNQLAQYQLGAAQRAEAKDVARSNALSKAGTDDTAIANALLQSGDLKGYSDFLKTRRETQKADVDLVDAKLKQSRSFLDTIDPSDPNAPSMYIAWHEANHKDPVLGPVLAARGVTADQSRQRIMDAIEKGPGAFATLLNQSKLGSEKFIELNKPQLSTKDTGSQLVDRTFEPLTGKITPLGTTAKTMTPGEVASNQVARANLNVAQQRLAQDAQNVSIQQDAQGNLVAIPTRLAAGAAPVARPVTGEGGAPVKGKPSAFAEKAAAQRTQMGKDLNFAISQLTEITKDGGLIDQSTGSGAGRLADVGMSFVGQATPGAIAIAKIAPVSDLVLKLVPRFEGPQSTFDVMSYKEAAGQLADPNTPTKIRKEAGRTVLRLMKERKGQFVTVDMAAEGTGAVPAGSKPSVAPPAGFTVD